MPSPLVTGDGADDITVVETITGTTRIETGGAVDRLAIRTIAGDTTVLTGAGDDAILVGSQAGFWPEGFYSANGTNDAIDAFLDIDGGAGTDRLEVDDTADDNDLTGTLGRVGDHIELRGLDLEEGIDYAGVEKAGIFLGTGNDTFTVDSTHVFPLADGLVLEGRGGNDQLRIKTIDTHTRVAGDGFEPSITYGPGNRVLSTGTGADTVVVRDDAATLDGIRAFLDIEGAGAEDALIVDDSGDANDNIGYLDVDTIAGLDMTKTTHGAHADRVNVIEIDGVVDGRFTITLGGQTTTELDFDVFPWELRDALEALPNVGEGNVEVVRSGGHFVITFRGALAGDAGWSLGTFEVTDVSLVGAAKRLEAFEMSEGRISYVEFEHLVLGLGSGGDVLGVDSTHAGTTLVNAGAGADRVTIETVSGATTVNAEAGDDLLLVNAHVGIPGPVLPSTLEEQGIDAPLALDGGFGADRTTINLFGNGGSFDRRHRLRLRRQVELPHRQRHARQRRVPAPRGPDRAAQRAHGKSGPAVRDLGERRARHLRRRNQRRRGASTRASATTASRSTTPRAS